MALPAHDGTVPPPAQHRAGRAPARRAALHPFPAGVVTPREFHDRLVAEGLVPPEDNQIYALLAKGCPHRHYDKATGQEHDAKQLGPDGQAATRPGVPVDAALAWWHARHAAA